MQAPTVHPPQPQPRATDVVTLARQYCGLIESSGADHPAWLRQVAALLPRLHAAVTSVEPHAAFERQHSVDLDARFELFSHLLGLLADRDGYFLEFDRAQEGPDAMTGSLADDLTDIYCELKSGLSDYETDPELALDSWCIGYDCHWGQHLTDAERHLTQLAASGRLG